MKKANGNKILNTLGICVIATLMSMLIAIFAVPNTLQVASAASTTVDINSYVDSDKFLNDSTQTIQSFAKTVQSRNTFYF